MKNRVSNIKKIICLNPSISIIMLNVKGQNTPY